MKIVYECSTCKKQFTSKNVCSRHELEHKSKYFSVGDYLVDDRLHATGCIYKVLDVGTSMLMVKNIKNDSNLTFAYFEVAEYVRKATVFDWLKTLDTEEFYNVLEYNGLDICGSCPICNTTSGCCDDKCKSAYIAAISAPLTDKIIKLADE